MDIEYLLFLQNLRNSTNNALTPFFESLSLFAVTYLVLVPVFVYWAIDKRHGLYTLASYYLCCGVNAVVKLTACVYRPWIRDARVLPAGDAITTATGYSFPSGHTVTAGPIYGGLAVSAWHWNKIVAVLVGSLAILTGFSRNYLGVHTPQDVAVGLTESIFWLIVMNRIFHYVDEHPEKEDHLLLGAFVFGWLAIAYITFKPYPMDYVNGQLLVDPNKMMNDGYGDIALIIGFAVARYIERKWVGFEASGLKGPGLFVSLAGLVPLYLMIANLRPVLDAALGAHWGHFLYNFTLVIYCICLVPAFIKLVSKPHEARPAESVAAAAEAA